MGEIAEMMLDGTMCSSCGEYLGGDDGYPVQCPSCSDADDDFGPVEYGKPKVSCPECRKRVKEIGLADHMRDKHGIQASAKGD